MYHTLLVYCRVNKFWFVEFGDHNYQVVKQEQKDCYEYEKCKIITTSENQKEIDSVVNSMNTELAKKRIKNIGE